MEIADVIKRDRLLMTLFWLGVNDDNTTICEGCEGHGVFYMPECCGDFSKNECCGQPIAAYDPCGICYGVGYKILSRGKR